MFNYWPCFLLFYNYYCKANVLALTDSNSAYNSYILFYFFSILYKFYLILSSATNNSFFFIDNYANVFSSSS